MTGEETSAKSSDIAEGMSKDTYEGQMLAGKRHGHGVYNYAKSGSKYDGGWKEDKRHGWGTFTKPGSVSKDEADVMFDGTWMDDMRHGYGTQRNGKRGTKEFFEYTGDFYHDHLQGFGNLTSGETKARYKGEFKNDKQDGIGGYFKDASNDLEYCGEWKDGKREGYGFYRCEKFTYVGQWKDGKMHGRGTYTSLPDDKDPYTLVYTGDFKEGQRDGQGTEFRVDARPTEDGKGGTSEVRHCSYTGGWLKNQRHGHGTFFYDNGAKVTGEWKEGKLMSPGTFSGSSPGTVSISYDPVKHEDAKAEK